MWFASLRPKTIAQKLSPQRPPKSHGDFNQDKNQSATVIRTSRLLRYGPYICDHLRASRFAVTVNLLSFRACWIAGRHRRIFHNLFATMAAHQHQTRILTVQRLSKGPEGDQSLSEWWAAERSRGTPEAAAVVEAADALRTTDVPVAFPTETVYGLGADATRSTAVRGIYKAKQRPSDNPLIVHVDSLNMLQRLLNPATTQANGATTPAGTVDANVIPPIYKPLIERFWPGPLTIILPNPPGSLLAKEVTSNLPTFGVRMPSSPFARLLIHVTDRPLAAPSANASTKPSPTTAQHVYHDLHGRIDIILDGGPCGVGVESTVVDGLTDPPAILRPGGIGIEELRSCPGWENVKIAYHDGSLQVKEVPRAPGMKYRHYSPKAKVVLFEPGSDPAHVARRVHEDLENGAVGAHSVGIVRTRHWPKGLGLIPESELAKATASQEPSSMQNGARRQSLDTESPPEVLATTAPPSPACFNITVHDKVTGTHKVKAVYDYPLGADLESIARGLFSALRALDELNVDIIYVEGISDRDGDLAAAIMNRLRKAAEAEIKV